MKYFVRALEKEGEGFNYLKRLSPQLSETKLKEGIFIEPQIRQVICDSSYLIVS